MERVGSEANRKREESEESEEPGRLLKKGVHHKDTRAPRFRKGWFAWVLDKHFFVSW